MKTRCTPRPLPAPHDFAVDPEIVTLVETALALSHAPTTGTDPVHLRTTRRDLDALCLAVSAYVEEVAS